MFLYAGCTSALAPIERFITKKTDKKGKKPQPNDFAY